jgi:hypothetical protein
MTQKVKTKSFSIGIFPIYILLIIAKVVGWVSLGWFWVITFPLWFGFLWFIGVMLGTIFIAFVVFVLGVLAIIIDNSPKIK